MMTLMMIWPWKRKRPGKLYSMVKLEVWITQSVFKAWISRQKLVLGIQCIQHSDCPSLMAKTRKVQIDFLIASFLFKFSLTYFVVERASEIVGIYNCSFALWDCKRLSSADFNLLTLKPVHWLCQRPALFSVLSVFSYSYHVIVCWTRVKRFKSP